MIYTYHINLDERGSFFADVRDIDGYTVYEINAGDLLGAGETSIFEDGFMRDSRDTESLKGYLEDLKVIPLHSQIIHAA